MARLARAARPAPGGPGRPRTPQPAARNLAGSMTLPERSAAPARGDGPARPVRGLRRRTHHRCDRARGRSARLESVGLRSSRAWPPWPRRDGDADPSRALTGRGPRSRLTFCATGEGLTSLHGVRPGPWLRRRVPRSKARRSTEPMPVAGKTVHVTGASFGGRRITVRLRGKTCLAPVVQMRRRPGRRPVVAEKLRDVSAGDCGVEDQVGRTGSISSTAERGAEAGCACPRRAWTG